MIKIFAAFAILTVMISTVSVYKLKQATYDLEETKRAISAQILKDREAIKVLKAEMAYLSRPERLERLSRRHLVLDAPETGQLAVNLAGLTVRDNVQMINMPVDNFQLLLPRQKPNPMKARRVSETITVARVRADHIEPAIKADKPSKIVEQHSLFDRILAKIGN
ncbi:MAG: hypothetical protein JKY84_12630 [Emcibacteraceae bacterium]|nr:hypothetical protein [Emcibacteraceae bacterium]